MPLRSGFYLLAAIECGSGSAALLRNPPRWFESSIEDVPVGELVARSNGIACR